MRKQVAWGAGLFPKFEGYIIGWEMIAYRAFYLMLALFQLIDSVNGQPKSKIEYYSTEHGLSHQAVTTMLKDREGFMWFGSWDGINRFDGHKFIAYKSFPGDLSQLKNVRIEQIVEGRSDYLWLAAYDREVYRFDKKTGQFLPLSTIITKNGSPSIAFKKILSVSNGLVWLESVNEGIFCVAETNLSKGNFVQYKAGLAADYHIPSNTINFFHEDSTNKIWIGTQDGLCWLTRSDSGLYKSNKIVESAIGTGNITTFSARGGKMYFGTADGRLILYNKDSNKFTVRTITSSRINHLRRSKKRDVIYASTSGGDLLTVDCNSQKITSVKYRTAESLHSLYEDRNGFLWIEPEKSGVILFDPSNNSFTPFSQSMPEGIKYTGNRFRVLEDNNGLVWISLKGGGFGYYNAEKGRIDNVVRTPDAAGFQLPNIIITLYYDKSGVLWLNTYERDLVKVILQGNDFKQQLLVDKKSPKTENEVRGIYSDNKNRLWVGTKSGQLYVYQNGKRVTDLFENEPERGFGSVYSILHDKRGNIWIGTKGDGLFKATPKNAEGSKYYVSHFAIDKTDPDGLHCNEIYSLLEDRQGRIWIGSFDNGLTLISEKDSSIKFIQSGNAFKNYPKRGYHKIRHMALDSGGNIWIGTTNGLMLLDADDHHAKVYSYKTYGKIPGDKASLGSNNIQFVYRDSKSRMWLSTSGCLSLATGNKPFEFLQFRNYTIRDGMPNDYLLSCAEDKQGNLWIATENGLSKFNPERQVFRNYNSYDGLPKSGFSEAAACGQVENLFFGTTNGVLSFNPDSINVNRIPANIVFTNLQINNEDAGPGMNEVVLKTNINYVADLTLKYNQNIISIDYAILDHRAGSRQEFAYRLMGFDSAWHNDRQLRRATYTNLPPGHYVFEVKSFSTDLYSNTPFKRLLITIQQPPWKTGWAYLLYALLMGALLFFIRRYALAMIRLRHKIAVEQKLAALKLNFFTNVSHELRTPLTLIVNPLEQLSKKEKLSSEGASYVDVARKNAVRMVRFINQLLDLRKVQSEKASLQISRVEIVTFVKKIADHFTEAARNKRIKLDIIADQKALFAWVDAEKLDVVIYNLLGNAVKFTPEGKVIRVLIETSPDEHDFSIAVYDQGPGVEQGQLDEIFELFHEGDQPAGRELKGTGIGLALSKEFVHLHGGQIQAVNNKDGGLTVTVKLQLGVDHYKQKDVSFVDPPKTSVSNETPIEQQLLPQPLPAALPKNEQAPLVLLVEDNEELRAFLKGQLSEFYRVETAREGQEGFEKAVALVPDLIVSDIMMPVMDGIRMLDKVKNDINTSHIPVVLLSARYSIESQIEGLKYGADFYITKPFNNDFLIASIDNLLKQRKKLFEALLEKKKTIDLGPAPIVVTSKDEAFLKEVIRVVEEKMTDPDFKIEMVAESMAMSRSIFYNKFKSLTSLTPVEFVRDMRLQRARQYLDAGGSNISEAAYLAGFSNPKYFSTCFKEKYHVSPSDYLKAKAR